jgi:hypothetical protein
MASLRVKRRLLRSAAPRGLLAIYWAIGWYFSNYYNPAISYSYPCDAANWQYYSERPDVEQNDYYGPSGPFGVNGAWQHYLDYGQYEGMSYHVELCRVTLNLGQLTDSIAYTAWLTGQELAQ